MACQCTDPISGILKADGQRQALNGKEEVADRSRRGNTSMETRMLASVLYAVVCSRVPFVEVAGLHNQRTSETRVWQRAEPVEEHQ